MGSVHGEDTEGSGGRGAVAGHLLAAVAGHHDTAAVHVILPVANLAGGQSVAAHGEGFAPHGQRVGVETVGALLVVGVEHGWGVQGAESHNHAVVVADDIGAPLVDAVDDTAAALSGIVGEGEVGGTAGLHLALDEAEDAGRVDVHGAGQDGVVVLAVVDGQVAGSDGVLILGIAAGEQEQQGREQQA